jgi:hypothetical protein
MADREEWDAAFVTPTHAAKGASWMGHPLLSLGEKRQRHGWGTRPPPSWV